MPRGVYVRTPEYRAKQSQAHRGRKMPPEAVAKRTGPRNEGWKGDDVSYVGLHQWLRRARGRAAEHVCAHADASCRGQMQWANISHEYRRDLTDYMVLCASHHKRFDNIGKPLKTHCPHGHPYSGPNLILYRHGPSGKTFRRCRACHNAADRARKARMTAERRLRARMT